MKPKTAHEFVSDMAEQISMPDVYADIRKLLLQPNTTVDDFIEVIEADSMLAVRVMRMASSPYFGFPRACENLHQAISLIGFMQLHDLLLGTLSMRTFAAIPEEVLNLKAFWRYNVQCGIAAKSIAGFSKVDNPQVFFSLGLLHEIGHATMFVKEPEASLRALDDSLSGYRTLAEAEQDYLGFDYGQVGYETAQLWHLPPVYQQVAAYHLAPELASEEYRPAVEVVHLAHEFCQDTRAGQRDRLIGYAIKSNPRFAELPPNMADLLAREIDVHTDSVLDLLWPCCAPDSDAVIEGGAYV